MSNSTTEVILGGGVLAAALAFGVYAAGVADLGGGTAGYDLRASFRSAEGIAVGTDVRLAGVSVGTVTGLSLNTETYRADTVVRIAETVQVPDDSVLLIASEGLLGGNYVEISPGGSPFYLEPGDAFFDTQGSVSLLSLLTAFFGRDGE